MKRITLTLMMLLIVLSCSDDDTSTVEKKQFVVDEIFDYHNNSLAKYYYNDQNQLIKRTTTDPINDRSSQYEFDYVNNRISTIIYTDFTFPQFNHNIQIYYNQQGQIIKDATYKEDLLVDTRDYVYYANGTIKGILDSNGESHITYIYNNTENIEQVKVRVLDDGTIGNSDGYIEIFNHFEYDTGNKPNFGIHPIFQFEPLPYFGTAAMFEKNISIGNMTKNLGSGTTWTYQYNEFDLPETIETNWEGIETLDPILLRIQYKEVQ